MGKDETPRKPTRREGAGSSLPSREELLRFIEENPDEVTKRTVARAFRVKGDERADLRHMLRELQSEGVLEGGHRRRMRRADRLPSVMVLDVIEVDADGDLIARPAPRAGESPGGDAPRIRIPREGYGGAAPDVGARLLARIQPDGEGGHQGRLLKVLPRRPDRVLGVIERTASGLRLRPIDRKAKEEYAVAGDEAGDAAAGDLALAEVLPSGRLGLARARVIERLGHEDDPAAVSMIAAFAHGLPVAFPPEVVAEADQLLPAGPDGRQDLRELDLVTIDGPDARDFDDAVFAETDTDPKNPGGHVVVVAIADVAHYVRPGTALDREALRRGNSAYFPDRVLPMLPEALSNGLCSLRPEEDRACLSVRMVLDRDGNLVRHRFHRALMRSRARLTYEQVQAAEQGVPDATTAPLQERVIRPLYAAFRALDKARARRGTIDLDLPEFQVVTDAAHRPVEVKRRERLDSHRLIEEMMIAANVAAAETLERAGMPCMYRVHDRPDPVKVEVLAEFLDSLGVPCRAATLRRPEDFKHLLARLDGHELLPMVSGFVLRAQAQAQYSPDNIGHFGLNLERYAHFTSPIRRYADLVVHRALIRGLGMGAGGLADPVEHDALQPTGAHISRTERRAMEAERQALARFVSLYMAERIGGRFKGRVGGVQPFGLFVVLDETGAEGLVPVSSLGAEYFNFDGRHHALVGERSREAYAVGDAVEIELAEVDVAAGRLMFRLVEHQEGAAARRAREAPRRPARPPRRSFRRR